MSVSITPREPFDSGAAAPPPGFPPPRQFDAAALAALEFQAGPPSGDATRHLCAAAYLDREFRETAIAELVENQHRFPAACPGVDCARVLDACLRARRTGVIAGSLVVAVTLPGLLVVPVNVISALWIVVTVRLFTWSLGPILRRGGSGGALPWREIAKRLLIGAAASFALLATVAGLIALLVVETAVSVFTGFGGAGSTAPGGSGIDEVPTLGVFAVWVGIQTWHRYELHKQLAALHDQPAREPGAPFPALSDVFARLRARPGEAETLYSDFSPFVGAGVRLDGQSWSFPIELRPKTRPDGSREPVTQPLDLPAVHRAIAQDVIRLAQSNIHSGNLYFGDVLRQLAVRNRVFRSGRRRDAPDAWYGRLSAPAARDGRLNLLPQWADLLDLGSHERIRHYLEVRTEIWEHQVVATLFVRAYVQGGLLQVEGIAFVLPPIDKAYWAVDDVLPPDPLRDGWSALWQALRWFAYDATTAFREPCAAIRSAVRTTTRQNWYQRMLALGRPVDHGPRVSLRELGADTEFQQLFQQLDVQRFFTGVRERTFSSVVAQLKQAGYDTAEFEQAAQFVNNGTMNVNAGSGIQNVNSPNWGNQSAGRRNTTAQTQTQAG